MVALKELRGRRALVYGSACAGLGITILYILIKLNEELSIRADARVVRRLIAERDFRQARGPLEHWLNARPRSAEAWFLAAQELFNENNLEQGFSALERARGLGHPLREIERQKAIVLSRLGKHNEAEPVLRRLLLSSSEPDPEADEALAKSYFETFRLGEAESVIDRWIRDAPGNVKPLQLKLELARKIKADISFQIEILHRILEVDPASHQARLDLAGIHLQNHRLDDAAREYTALLERKPESSAAYHGLGMVSMERGDLETAVHNLDVAIKLDPRNARLLADRAKLEIGKGHLESALSFLDKALTLDAAEPEVHYQRSLTLARLGRSAEAKSEMDASSRLREESAHVQKLLDEMLIAPGDLDRQYDAARWLFEHGHPEEGLRWAEKILRDQPKHTKTNRLLADYYMKQGNQGLANFYQLQTTSGP